LSGGGWRREGGEALLMHGSEGKGAAGRRLDGGVRLAVTKKKRAG
jgi:hypothetical protein